MTSVKEPDTLYIFSQHWTGELLSKSWQLNLYV